MLSEFAQHHAAELSQHEQLSSAEYLARLPARAQAGDMNLVMKTYEREIQRPILSLLFGDLMRGLLIQIQKVRLSEPGRGAPEQASFVPELLPLSDACVVLSVPPLRCPGQ